MTLRSGGLKVKDPVDVVVAQFNFDTLLDVGVTIASYTLAVTGKDAGLVVTDLGLASGNRKVNFRVSAGTLGRKYKIACQILTGESPALPKQRSFKVLVEEQ